MSHWRINSALLASFALSVILHVTVLVPLWMLSLNSSASTSLSPAELSAEEFQQQQTRNEAPLGLDAPNPSSLTWVGYEQYEEHIAALAAFEQAAFTEHPGDPMRDSVSSPEQQPAEVAREQEVESEATQLTTVTQAMQQPLDAEAPVAEPMEAPQAPEQPSAPEHVEVVQVAPIVVPPQRTVGDLPWIRSLIDAIELQPAAGQAPEQTQEQDEPEHSQEQEPAENQPQQPQPPSAGGAAGETPRPQSDRDSDSFSTIDADPRHWRDGQPLAAHGVEVKPQRPHFTLLQRITASPGNPLVVIRFRSDGVPHSAKVVQSSGSLSVDASIEASLYRWRASGETIDQLEDGLTFDVSIRIVLNPRAAAQSDE